MPMLVVNEEEFNIEIGRLKVDYRTIERGRGLGKKETPVQIRKLVASEAIAGVKVEDIRESYNISPSSISAYKNGATSTASYNKPDKELDGNNKQVRAVLSERAESVALEAIGLLTLEKMESSKAKDISSIAKDMSSVISNMRDSNGNGGPKVNVMIYQPQIREEADFKVIDIKE